MTDKFWICFVGTVVLEIAIAKYKDKAARTPFNYICFFIFTIAFGMVASAIIYPYYEGLPNGSYLAFMHGSLCIGLIVALAIYATFS